MLYFKITAEDAVKAKIIDKEEIEDAKRQLPENVFNELYLCEASDDEGNPFGITNIRNCIYAIGSKPASVFGIDLAKSVDWTVIIGLDARGLVCYYERFQADWKNTRERIKSTIEKTPTWIDSTGVGDPIVEDLQREFPNIQGYKFTQSSKQQLIEGLVMAIQQGKIAYPEGSIVSELESFEYTYTRTGVKYSAPEGLHDDCVCALALANHGLITKPVIGSFIPEMIDNNNNKKNTLEW